MVYHCIFSKYNQVEPRLQNKKGDTKMNCFYCKGEMAYGVTNHVVSINKCVIIVKHVPCTECSQCGAAFYNDDVMTKLDEIVSNMRKEITEIAVISYPSDVVA